MLNSKERATLRGQANELRTIFQLGKDEIDEAFIKQIDGALETRELIKLHVLENSKYSARDAAQELAESTGSEVVQVIGSRFVLYRESKTLPKDKRISLK